MNWKATLTLGQAPEDYEVGDLITIEYCNTIQYAILTKVETRNHSTKLWGKWADNKPALPNTVPKFDYDSNTHFVVDNGGDSSIKITYIGSVKK